MFHASHFNSHKGKQAPGALASVDNQGNLELCTRYSLAKAVVNGFEENIFTNGPKLDFSQNAVAQILVNEHKVSFIFILKQLYVKSYTTFCLGWSWKMALGL